MKYDLELRTESCWDLKNLEKIKNISNIDIVDNDDEILYYIDISDFDDLLNLCDDIYDNFESDVEVIFNPIRMCIGLQPKSTFI